MVAEELTTNATFIGQPETMKQSQNSAAENAISYEGMSNANLQLQATHREPTSFQNVGELLNAKRSLPVTPFSVQPAGSMNMDQESLPATPSITELVSLMEQLHIVPPVAPATNYVACVSDSNSDDKENVLFPELQSLGEQFQIVPSTNPALIMFLVSLILNQMMTPMLNMYSSLSYKV